MWDHVAEARIREWLMRPASERSSVPVAHDPALPLEIQLLQDVTQLDRMAAAAAGPEATLLKTKADELMMRAMMILESQGRPLAAQHFAEQRQAARKT
jgi:hypothetical protein